MTSSSNASDLDIADLDWPASVSLLCSECGRGFGCSPVEGQHAAAKYIIYGDIEGVTESVAPAAWG